MEQIFTASTLEEAKQMAEDAFGVPASEISFEVLEEPKRTLLGGLFGKKDAEFRVRASWQSAGEAAQATAAETFGTAEEEIAAPADTQPAAAAETVSDAPAEEPEAEDKPDWEDIPEEIRLAKMELAVSYLQQVLAQLAPDVSVSAKLENGIAVTLEGDSPGVLIGRRGDTLDALQYLTSMVANRGDKDYVRLTIDACGYRSKRRKALQELAQRISKNVLRTGRSVALEPMNPYERRIIHSTVTEIEGVSSHSSGEEPYRKVIITSDSAPAYKRDDKNARGIRSGNGGRRDRNDRGGRGERRDRRDRGERRPPVEARKLDLSTSFERDYKRPKPEDSLNAGVYGKIDI